MKRIALMFVFLTVLSCSTFVFSQDDKDKKTPVVTEERITPEMNIANNKLTLKNAPVGRKVEIFAIIGNKMREIKITTPDLEQELNLPRGLYIFKMDDIVKKNYIK